MALSHIRTVPILRSFDPCGNRLTFREYEEGRVAGDSRT